MVCKCATTVNGRGLTA